MMEMKDLDRLKILFIMIESSWCYHWPFWSFSTRTFKRAKYSHNYLVFVRRECCTPYLKYVLINKILDLMSQFPAPMVWWPIALECYVNLAFGRNSLGDDQVDKRYFFIKLEPRSFCKSTNCGSMRGVEFLPTWIAY